MNSGKALFYGVETIADQACSYLLRSTHKLPARSSVPYPASLSFGALHFLLSSSRLLTTVFIVECFLLSNVSMFFVFCSIENINLEGDTLLMKSLYFEHEWLS